MCIRDRFKTFRKVDEELLEELEEALISADVGVQTSMDIIESLRDKAKEENIKDADQLKEALREIISGMMDQEPQEHTAGDGLAVILVIGVNGVGTVSYTHLDVYKRQAQEKVNRRGSQ